MESSVSETANATQRKQGAPEGAPPACYGTGKVKVPLRYHEAFDWVSVHPRTCAIECSTSRQRLCLAHQRRMGGDR